MVGSEFNRMWENEGRLEWHPFPSSDYLEPCPCPLGWDKSNATWFKPFNIQQPPLHNRPFAASHSRSTKPPCWRAKVALGQDKQRKLPFQLMYVFCLVPVRLLLSSMTGFVPVYRPLLPSRKERRDVCDSPSLFMYGGHVIFPGMCGKWFDWL